MNQTDAPTEASIRNGCSPFLQLAGLFLKPAQFFSSLNSLKKPLFVIPVTLCLGIATTIDTIERNLMRGEIGRASSTWEKTSTLLFNTWSNFWVFLLIAGALTAPLLWYGGGWWYRVRLRWSGASHPDKLTPRLLYAYSSLVFALPVVALTLVETVLFPSYPVAREAEGWFVGLCVVFLLVWSVFVSYKGATTAFQLTQKKAVLWFLVLPWLYYAGILGVITWLYMDFFERLAGTI